MKGNLETLVSAYVRGEGITAAAQAAGMSRSTAWTRLKSPEAQQMIRELKAEMRAGFQDWPLRLRAVGDMVLDSIVDVLDGEPDPAVVARLAGIVLPELRYLLADAHQWAEEEPKQSSADAREELMRKLGIYEERAKAVLESRVIPDEMKRSLGYVPPHN